MSERAGRARALPADVTHITSLLPHLDEQTVRRALTLHGNREAAIDALLTSPSAALKRWHRAKRMNRDVAAALPTTPHGPGSYTLDVHNRFCKPHFCRKHCCPQTCGTAPGASHHIVFLHIEKTGGSSVECASQFWERRGFWTNMGHVQDHADVRDCTLRCQQPNRPNETKLAIVVGVRNPYNYWRSVYKYAWQCAESDCSAAYLYLAATSRVVSVLKNFRLFMRHMLAYPATAALLSLTGRMQRACGPRGCSRVADFVLRAETLTKDWHLMLKRYGYGEVQLPHINEEAGIGAWGSAPPARHTNETRAIVNHIEKSVFSTFGYVMKQGLPRLRFGFEERRYVSVDAPAVDDSVLYPLKVCTDDKVRRNNGGFRTPIHVAKGVPYANSAGQVVNSRVVNRSQYIKVLHRILAVTDIYYNDTLWMNVDQRAGSSPSTLWYWLGRTLEGRDTAALRKYLLRNVPNAPRIEKVLASRDTLVRFAAARLHDVDTIVFTQHLDGYECCVPHTNRSTRSNSSFCSCCQKRRGLVGRVLGAAVRFPRGIVPEGDNIADYPTSSPAAAISKYHDVLISLYGAASIPARGSLLQPEVVALHGFRPRQCPAHPFLARGIKPVPCHCNLTQGCPITAGVDGACSLARNRRWKLSNFPIECVLGCSPWTSVC